MKKGDVLTREELAKAGFTFCIYYGNCEVFRRGEMYVFWEAKTQTIICVQTPDNGEILKEV